MKLYIIEWDHRDFCSQGQKDEDEEDVFEIMGFGKTSAGESTVARIRFFPYMYVKVPQHWSFSRQRLFVAECVKDLRAQPIHSCPVTRKDAWGYTEDDGKFVQLAFDTLKRQKVARSRLSSNNYEIFEGNVDPIIRMCHVRKISPTGWVSIDKYSDVSEQSFQRSDREIVCEFTHVHPCDDTSIPPLILCSWDIEVFSHDGAFPTSDHPENKVIQIAAAFKRLGEPEPYRKVVVCLDATSPVEGAEIISVDEEHRLLSEFVSLLDAEKTDVLMGWNTWQFDWRYLVGRESVLLDDDGDPLVSFSGLGRGGPKAGQVRTWELNSGAYGQNVYMLIRAPGVLDLDLMQLTKRDHKLDSYSLNNVSAKFLGDTKVDLPAHEIFKKFVGTPDDRADIARYAVQDVCLPLRLFDKLCMYDNLAQMSVATCVPMDYLLSRGQQIKVYSLILQQAKELGYVLPDNKKMTISGKFEGATVLDAQKGAYFDIISGLDFASLYPSIIRSYNMCYSTLILPGSPKPKDSYTVETGLGVYTFAQSPKGIVPQLLENLAVWRKNAKKKMAECKKNGDSFGASVWNGAQLAFKVSANSVYGFLGASKGFLPCVPIAASVTATGRNMIEKTKNMALQLVPGSNVVYGDTDSVMVQFNVPDEHRHDMAYHFKIAEDVAQKISDTFPGCIELEFEKCYYPYLLYSKKRYAGLMFTRPESPDYIDVKGLQLVRRDNAPIVKQVSQSILDSVMYDKSVDKALVSTKDCIVRMLSGEFPMESFIVSKSLRGSYANPNSQPHVQVARKIKERTGEIIESGARVPYVFVVDEETIHQKLISQRAEDPTFAKENDLQLDYLYYLDNQIMSPVCALLEVLMDNPASILDSPEISRILAVMRCERESLVRTVKRIKKNKDNRQCEITSFFKTGSSPK